MGMTMTEKILAKHAGIDVVKPGQLINCKLDMVLANDVTAPPAIKEFEKIGKPVFDYCEPHTCDSNHELGKQNSQRI